MQKKLFELLGKPVCDGDVGVEIEAEGVNLLEVNDKYWHTEDDGSLRGHYPDSKAEFVFKKPILVTDVKKALEVLSGKLAANGAVLDFSYRCSVHVHVNVQQLTYTQLLNMIYTYLLIEEPCMVMCGKSRKGNNFCLRLQDAEGLLDNVHRMFAHGEAGLRYAPDNEMRYSAINLAAVKKYGSVEFRAMEGNLDVNRIDSWTRILCAIRDYASKQESPKDIFNQYTSGDPVRFLRCVLGDLADLVVYPRVVRDIQNSFSISLDLPFAYDKFMEKEAKKPAKVENEINDWKVGDHVNYKEAVELLGRKGLVKALPLAELIWEDKNYQVVKECLDPPRGPVRVVEHDDDDEEEDDLEIEEAPLAVPAAPDRFINWNQEAPVRAAAVFAGPVAKRRGVR